MDVPIIDLHQDLYWHLKWPHNAPVRNQTSLRQLRKQNVRLVVSSGYFTGSPSHEASGASFWLYQQRNLSFYKNLDSRFSLVVSAKDITSSYESGITGILFHIEGLEDFVGDKRDWIMLERLYQEGLRSVSLTCSGSNWLAGGNMSVSGLSRIGHEVVQWISDRSMLLDFAHLNEHSFFEVFKMWPKPIFVSHANARTLSTYGQDRNLSDRQIRAVGESKGLIGVTFSRNLVRQSRFVTVDDLINHIAYIADLIGVQHVAIGSDFGGLLHGSPIKGLRRLRDISKLWEALHLRGFTSEEIESIAWKNAHNFLLKNL